MAIASCRESPSRQIAASPIGLASDRKGRRETSRRKIFPAARSLGSPLHYSVARSQSRWHSAAIPPKRTQVVTGQAKRNLQVLISAGLVDRRCLIRTWKGAAFHGAARFGTLNPWDPKGIPIPTSVLGPPHTRHTYIVSGKVEYITHGNHESVLLPLRKAVGVNSRILVVHSR